MVECKVEEVDIVEQNDKGVMCRFNKETKGWEPIEDHCNQCGEKECDCLECFSALAILEPVMTGGGGIK